MTIWVKVILSGSPDKKINFMFLDTIYHVHLISFLPVLDDGLWNLNAFLIFDPLELGLSWLLMPLRSASSLLILMLSIDMVACLSELTSRWAWCPLMTLSDRKYVE